MYQPKCSFFGQFGKSLICTCVSALCWRLTQRLPGLMWAVIFGAKIPLKHRRVYLNKRKAIPSWTSHPYYPSTLAAALWTTRDPFLMQSVFWQALCILSVSFPCFLPRELAVEVNTICPVCLCACVCVCLSALSQLNCLTYRQHGQDILHVGQPGPYLG